MFLSIDWGEWLEALEVDTDNVIDVSETVDEDIHMLAITLEIEKERVVMFFQFDGELSEWLLHFLLHFDLSIPMGLETTSGIVVGECVD